MHKVTILAVVVGMYVCSKRQRVCSVCALHLSVGMNLSRQESFRMHMGGWGWGWVKRWRLLGFVLEALWWSLVSQSLSLSATYPFLGKHPH